MNNIFDTPITKLLNDSMLKELYSRSSLHFRDVIHNTMLTLPNPNPATFPKFSEDRLKELLFDECVDYLQRITGDTTSIDNHPTLKNTIEERVNLCVTKSIYKERGVRFGLPFARWVWKDKLVSRITEDMVKLYIVGLISKGEVTA